MDKKQATSRIASILALDTAKHREAALNNSNLIENAKDGENKNIETAKALGFYDEYQYKVNLFAPILFYELK